MIKVGVIHFGYNSQRNFISLPFKTVRFVRVWDLHKIISFCIFKICGKSSILHDNFFNDFGLSKVDGYHFFNAVTPVKKPWIVTFEESIPRNRTFDMRTAKLLASENCKAIIALSFRAYNIQCSYLGTDKLAGLIKEKMFILNPSQKLLIDIEDKDFYNPKLAVTFVGRHFYRKGGLEVLRAVNRLRGSINFTLISNLEIDGWRDNFITDDMLLEVAQILADDNILHYSSLPNPEVLDILRDSNVLVMPSFGETYGYSVLEGMAAGCVPIVTNISAFSEFTNDTNSFIIDLEMISQIDSDGIWDIDNTVPDIATYCRNSKKIEDGVFDILSRCLTDRELLKWKSKNSIETIKRNHDPLNAIAKLEQVYREF